MALEIVTLRRIPYSAVEIDSVSMTADLKLISFTSKKNVYIYAVKLKENESIRMTNMYSLLWQEDIAENGCYKLLCIGEQQELLCHTFKLGDVDHSDILSLSSTEKWSPNFQNFLGIMKKKECPLPTNLLAFNSKEAVITYNEKFVVTFFLSSSKDPQIISFLNVSENMQPARQISLVKETIFVLNHAGTMLSAYSVFNNAKVFEVEISRANPSLDLAGVVTNFIVSLEKDIAVFYTKQYQMYFMSLEKDWDNIDGLPSGNMSLSTTNVVTAFAKEFPSIQSITDSAKRNSVTNASGLLQSVILSCDTSNLNLDYVVLYNGKLCFLFRSDDCTLVGVHKLVGDAITSHRRLQGKACIITGSSETFPLLILHEDIISLLLYDIEHDKLVNEMMIYQCSAAAQMLSDLNKWQNIHMDVEALQQGLRNRQLHAVEFFLKTYQEQFKQVLRKINADEVIEGMKAELSLWDNITRLLLETIHVTNLDRSSCHFAKQLMELTTAIAIQLLDEIHKSRHFGESEALTLVKNKALSDFSNCLKKIRQMLEADSDSDSSDSTSRSFDAVPEKISKTWKKWSQMQWQDVVKDSLLNGTIAMAQGYFFNREDTKLLNYSEFQKFQEVGLGMVSDYLQQNHLQEAVTVLSNLGISINEKLIYIFKTTFERDVRKLLYNELKSKGLLNDADESAYKFILLLEHLYPCTSFAHARQLLSEKSVYIEDYPKCAHLEFETPELDVDGEITPCWNDCETSAYCRISLDWVLQWNDDIKQRILVPHFLKGSYIQDIHITPGAVWSYLLEHGDSPLIIKWISNWLGQLPNHSSEEFPYNWPLDEAMINMIGQKAPKHVAEAALNELAMHGVYCKEELEDVNLFLSRAGKARCDLNNPEIFSNEKSSLPFSDLCHTLVHYGLKHNLVHFLYQFLLKHHNRFASWPICHLCDVSLFRMIKAFSVWSQNNEDSSMAQDAIVTSAEHIYGVSDVTPTKILQQVPTPLNMGLLLFNAKPLRETISDALSSGENIDTFKESLRAYPVLYDQLFNSKEDRLSMEPSVYQLLQENAPFDVSRLFGWQSTNTLKSDDSLLELPHFLMTSLAEQHGLKETLTHIYYLMVGRPNFAYLKYVSEELLSGNQISLPRVRSTCKEVFSFALSNFRNEKITSACVMFFELLGQDSLPLRVSLNNANFLFKQQTQNQHSEEFKEKVYNEIIDLFKDAEDEKESAEQIITLLESEIVQKYSNVPDRPLITDISAWMPVVALAHLYEVDVGNPYLHECAKNNEWLKFLVFAQIFQAPKEQVIHAATKFSNSGIGNHICKALEKNTHLSTEDRGLLSRGKFNQEKDLRKSYFSRIGVAKKGSAVHEAEAARSELEDDKSSACSIETSSSAELESGSEVIHKNLFMQLLYSHNTAVPWITLLSSSYLLHNPILSVLAASYPDSDYLCCFTTWLIAALHKKNTQKSFSERKNIVSSWIEADLEKYVLVAVKENKLILLREGVSLFLAGSPLLSFMEFIVSFLIYKKFDLSAEKLKQFQSRLWDYPKNDDPQSPLHSLRWIESIVIAILKEVVINCQNSYQRLLFLRHLYFSGLESTFSSGVSVPRFNKLYDMVQYSGDFEEDCDIETFLLPPTHPKYRTVCWTIVKKLQKCHKQNEAKIFARVAGLPSEQVLLQQVELDAEEIKKSSQWNNLSGKISFWKGAMKFLKDNNLNLQKIIRFFKAQYDISSQYGEKCFLLQLIIQSHRQSTEPPADTELVQLVANMWLCCLKEVKEQLPTEELDVLIRSQNEDLNIFDLSLEQACVEEAKAEKDNEALETIINCLLRKGCVEQALQVAKLFSYDYHELKVIEVCLTLVKCEIEPHDVKLEKMKLPGKRPQRTRLMSLVPWASFSEEGLDSAKLEIIGVLEKLCNEVEISAQICNRILINYIVSMVLNISYDNVAKNFNPFSVIKNVLSSRYKNKFNLAKSLITVHNLHDEEVANFLSHEIHVSLQLLPESSVMLPENVPATSSVGEDIIYNPAIVSESFQLVVKLCSDPSLLGDKLMNIVRTIASDSEILAAGTSLYEIAELCICAHECFTVACNVQGISQVLYKSRLLITSLEEAKKFPLIVRLLTGIGRYGEMSYVFDVLHEHREFELLLGKKMKKVPHLQSLTLALLDYIKRCPSADAEEYYSMLALNFSMHREIAEQIEMSARKLLTQLSKRNTDVGLKNELKNSMDDLADAAKSYVKGDCLAQAQLCAQLAKLVALQIYLLPSGTWIINLDNMAVSRCITEMSDFSQALIIAEAYNYPHSWSQALYYNVIIKDNWDYFRKLQAYLGISESLIEDVVKSFRLSPNKNENQIKNMKQLLSFCQDVELKYKFVNQLGFSDISANMLMGDSGAFLRDLIATTKQVS